jgi:hypothetical protein
MKNRELKIEPALAKRIKLLFVFFLVLHHLRLFGYPSGFPYLGYSLQYILIYALSYYMFIKLSHKLDSIPKCFFASIIISIVFTFFAGWLYNLLLVIAWGSNINEAFVPFVEDPFFRLRGIYYGLYGYMVFICIFLCSILYLKHYNPSAVALFRKAIPKILAGFIILSGLLWVFIFNWDWVRWPNYSENEIRCYSPSGEYYILRRQSLFNAMFFSPQDRVYGTARLYNKNGKLLYSEKTILSSEFGPHWFGNSVAYFGTLPEWYFKPPTPTGVQVATGIGECYNSDGVLIGGGY